MSLIKLFKEDFYERLGGLNFFQDRKVLDLGCGDGEDALSISRCAKRVVGIDVVKHNNWERMKSRNLTFVVSNGEELPFRSGVFDGIFEKDVLHHVGNPEKVMSEIRRVASKKAHIILIEGNRYNPLFYIHMTKMLGHEHFSQEGFKELVIKYFPTARFIHFESHFIPFIREPFFKIFIKIERVLSKMAMLRPFLSYNAAIINMGSKPK